MNIWQKLKEESVKNSKPFSILAPMEEVTDTVFRRLLMKIDSKPDLFFTEFTSVEGMNSVGRKKVEHRLKKRNEENNLILQIWGTNPEFFAKTAEEVDRMKENNFAGIDINMGCPVKKIIKNGGCSVLIRTPKLAKEIYLKTKNACKNLPVSIKTRLGFSKLETENWIGFLLQECQPDALIVHFRTSKEMSKFPVHEEEYEKVVDLKNKLSPNTVLVVNGDIKNVEMGEQICKKYGFDGFMIGRGIFEDPWLFNPEKTKENVDIGEKLQTLLLHTSLFEKEWRDEKNFAILRRFFKIYANGFDGASDLRVKLMETKNGEETRKVVETFLTEHKAQ